VITDREIKDYWSRYDWFIIKWTLVSFFGFPLLPIAYILKYWFKVKGLWLLNDTVDGDFGSKKELKAAGRKECRTLGNFWWWWFRNHSWNFNRKFIPEWNDGECEEFRIIKSNIFKPGTNIEDQKKIRWAWCSKNGIHGHHYIAARINGKIECRFSEANDKMQRQMGSGGNEYRFRFKNLIVIFFKRIKRLWL